ncbi:unnamed protein product, partial [Ascophyllum nodosum]
GQSRVYRVTSLRTDGVIYITINECINSNPVSSKVSLELKRGILLYCRYSENPIKIPAGDFSVHKKTGPVCTKPAPRTALYTLCATNVVDFRYKYLERTGTFDVEERRGEHLPLISIETVVYSM